MAIQIGGPIAFSVRARVWGQVSMGRGRGKKSVLMKCLLDCADPLPNMIMS